MRSMIFAAGLVAPAIASIGQAAPEQSTVYSTELVTITSCAATVTDCPARSTATSSTIHTLTQSTLYSTQYQTVSSSVLSTSYPVASTLVPVKPSSTTPAVESATSSNSPVGEGAPPANPSSAESATSSNSPVGEGAPPAAPSSATGVPALPTVSVAPTYSYTAVSPVYTTGAGAGAGAGAGSCDSYSVKTISTSITTVIPTVVYETVAVPCVTGGASGFSSSSPNGATGSGSHPNNATITASSPTSIVTAGASTWGASGALAAVAGVVAMFA